MEANGTFGIAVELPRVLGTGTRATELPGVLWPGVEVPGAVGVISYAEEVWGVGACTEGVPEAIASLDAKRNPIYEVYIFMNPYTLELSGR